jgi:hypothetical protein
VVVEGTVAVVSGGGGALVASVECMVTEQVVKLKDEERVWSGDVPYTF